MDERLLKVRQKIFRLWIVFKDMVSSVGERLFLHNKWQ